MAGRPHGSSARTSAAREQELIALAMDLTDQQLRDGTISSQTQSLLVKSGLGRERLERQRLEQENVKLRAQVEQIKAASQSDELLNKVLSAMRVYSGQVDPNVDDDEDPY
mgnify:CR=1 FL=1